MALVRWRPARDFLNIRDEIDRMFDEFFGTLPERLTTGLENVWTPSVDISETDNDIIVTAELPGVKKDDIKISLQDNVLTLRGEKKQEKEEKNENFHRVERTYGMFQRSFTLPAPVDANKIKARFKDGVLKITLPKTEEAKMKEIPISVE